MKKCLALCKIFSPEEVKRIATFHGYDSCKIKKILYYQVQMWTLFCANLPDMQSKLFMNLYIYTITKGKIFLLLKRNSELKFSSKQFLESERTDKTGKNKIKLNNYGLHDISYTMRKKMSNQIPDILFVNLLSNSTIFYRLFWSITEKKEKCCSEYKK